MPNNETQCKCGEFFKDWASSCTTGCGTTPEGEKICFKCCAVRDQEEMKETGKAHLYLHGDDPIKGIRHLTHLTNWPGTLKLHIHRYRFGKHNIARTRTDVWFIGPDGKQWWGVLYGENTQIVHCRRVKRQ